MSKTTINIILYAFTSLSGVIAILYPRLSLAQDTLQKVQQISDVIVTGQYGETSLAKSVYKVKVIDQSRIRAQGAYNLKDVIANELNVRISNDPALGSGLSVQGLSGQNVKIMIDGVPVVGREGGVLDITQLNLNNIERIEFVEGPMSVNFGTDALGGVINLITKKPKDKQAKVGVNAYYESIGQYNAGFTSSFSNTKWNLQVNGARNFFQGYSPIAGSRVQLFKPRTQYFGDINIGRTFKNASFRLQNSFFNEKVTNRDSAYISPYEAYANDQYYYTRRLSSSAFYHQTIRKHYQVDVVASYNYYRRINNTVRKDLVTLQETLIPSASLQDTSYFHNWMSRGTFSNNSKKRFSYQAGYEYNYEDNVGNKIAGEKKTIADYNLFGSTEIKITDRLLVRPAARFIYNTKFDAPVVPSLNIKWDVSEVLVLRASYGKGFRAPTLKELYLNFVDPSHNVHGNPNLNAEKQDNYQLSAAFEWKKSNHVFRIEPGLFYNNVKNRIDLGVVNQSQLEYQYINIGQFQSVGANLSTEYRTPKYSFILGYARTGISNSIMQQAGTDQFFFTNEARANFNYKFIKPGVTCALFYKYNGKLQTYMYDATSTDPANSTTVRYINGYSLMDASISKDFFHKQLAITMGAKNLFNVVNVAANMPGGVHASQSNAASIGMGRSFFVSCVYQLDFANRNKTNDTK